MPDFTDSAVLRSSIQAHCWERGPQGSFCLLMAGHEGDHKFVQDSPELSRIRQVYEVKIVE